MGGYLFLSEVPTTIVAFVETNPEFLNALLPLGCSDGQLPSTEADKWSRSIPEQPVEQPVSQCDGKI